MISKSYRTLISNKCRALIFDLVTHLSGVFRIEAPGDEKSLMAKYLVLGLPEKLCPFPGLQEALYQSSH